MLQVNFDGALEQRVHELAAQAGQSTGKFIAKAVRQAVEDREDYLLGIAALREGGRTYSQGEVRLELGLDS
jgi:predicted DNA-binding protein